MIPSGAASLWPLRAIPGGRRQEACGLPASLARLGPLEVRLARTGRDVRLAQRLRYRVFYEEMAAVPGAWARLVKRDRDGFDADCDHLLVLDHSVRTGAGRGAPAVVGTYRLLRQEVAERRGGFYTAGEFDIGPLVRAHPGRRFLELGRSCVLAPYRTKRTVELLWRGIYAYVLHHRIDVMIGCASLEGTDPESLSGLLAFLHRHAAGEAPWIAVARADRRVAMEGSETLTPAEAFRALPPLLKGYLRLGAMVGDGAVVDLQFRTTDVLIILPVERIRSRYLEFFAPQATRDAA